MLHMHGSCLSTFFGHEGKVREGYEVQSEKTGPWLLALDMGIYLLVFGGIMNRSL